MQCLGGRLIANRCNKGFPIPQIPVAARYSDVTSDVKKFHNSMSYLSHPAKELQSLKAFNSETYLNKMWMLTS